MIGRALPVPPALAGLDLDAHRERAVRALVLFFGGDLSTSPAEWEERARAVLDQLAIYGVAPVGMADPALGDSGPRGPEILRNVITASHLLDERPGA
jgi:hypothetical protein